jgi:hypothetical protein
VALAHKGEHTADAPHGGRRRLRRRLGTALHALSAPCCVMVVLWSVFCNAPPFPPQHRHLA